MRIKKLNRNFDSGIFWARLIFIVCLIFCATSPVKAELKVGEPASKLLVRTLSGKDFDLQSYRGKVVVLHFWATWCSACQKEMPILSRFYEIYHHKNVELMALSVDRSRERKEVMMKAAAFPFLAAMISDARESGFGAVNSLPVTYVIDTKGKVIRVFQPGGNELTDKNLAEAYEAATKASFPDASDR